MTVALASPARARLPRRVPSVRARATAPFELLIVAAWLGIVVWVLLATGSGAGSDAGAGMGSMPGMDMTPHTTATRAAVIGLPMWALMSLAMMLPGALPALSYVATHSYRWRRQRAMAQFAGVYLGLWVAFGALSLGLVQLVHTRAWREVAAALAIAAVWELTAFKRRALRDCHRTVRLPLEGRGASLGPARFGLLNGSACLRACWPMMLAMAAVPGTGMLAWMPVLTVLTTGGKLARRPQRASRIVAGALVIAALVADALA